MSPPYCESSVRDPNKLTRTLGSKQFRALCVKTWRWRADKRMNSLYGWALRFEAVRGALSSQSTDQPGIRVEACDRLGQVLGS